MVLLGLYLDLGFCFGWVFDVVSEAFGPCFYSSSPFVVMGCGFSRYSSRSVRSSIHIFSGHFLDALFGGIRIISSGDLGLFFRSCFSSLCPSGRLLRTFCLVETSDVVMFTLSLVLYSGGSFFGVGGLIVSVSHSGISIALECSCAVCSVSFIVSQCGFLSVFPCIYPLVSRGSFLRTWSFGSAAFDIGIDIGLGLVPLYPVLFGTGVGNLFPLGSFGLSLFRSSSNRMVVVPFAIRSRASCVPSLVDCCGPL